MTDTDREWLAIALLVVGYGILPLIVLIAGYNWLFKSRKRHP
jgi:hypothetical protein